MHIAYCDESQDSKRTVVSSIVIPDANWRVCFDYIRQWRRQLKARYGIPIHYEIHSSDLISGHGKPGGRVNPLGRRMGCILYMSAIQTLSGLSAFGAYGINTSLLNANYKRPLRAATGRVVQRLENNLHAVTRGQRRDEFGMVVYDGITAQHRTMVQRVLRQMQVFNLIPSKIHAGTYYGKPVTHILGDPVIRDSADDVFIQMADVMAHALLRQDNPPTHPVSLQYGIDKAFGQLGAIWHMPSSPGDPQGVVRN